MKRLLVLATLPLMLFALERVNLIRNSGFEKNDSSWIVQSGSWKNPNPAVGLIQDNTMKVKGDYSASVDTREEPVWQMINARDSACIRQYFLINKRLKDFDSLYWFQAIVPLNLDPYLSFACLIGMTFAEPDINGFGYGFVDPTGLAVDYWISVSEHISSDTSWIYYQKSITLDFSSLDPDLLLGSFTLNGWGAWFDIGDWRGQKIYWDEIKLTGYADYDVGIKVILSGDSVWKSTAYTPTARIKNFGRKAADTFLVIAEIKNGVSIVYSDTMPYSLPADTEDTLSFKVFTPPQDINYTLTIRTEMNPDESDEDDEMSKTLYGSGIGETPTFSNLQLDIVSLSSVRYTLPSGEQGTIALYDPSGRRIESYRVQGEGQVAMKAGLSSGVYFVKLEAGKASVTRKAVVLR
jgi:hypothetical protein